MRPALSFTLPKHLSTLSILAFPFAGGPDEFWTRLALEVGVAGAVSVAACACPRLFSRKPSQSGRALRTGLQLSSGASILSGLKKNAHKWM